MAARAVQIATNGDNQALSGIATVNGALILEHAVSTDPAIPTGDRAAALALAEAYSNAQAIAATVQQRDDPLWQSTISDVNTKDAAMKNYAVAANFGNRAPADNRPAVRPSVTRQNRSVRNRLTARWRSA
ncbi:MAG: hypothetical protein VX424_01355 [Actinomycetota bacterium]|nr:hypothetical protein [Actinomycetota bacterium]